MVNQCKVEELEEASGSGQLGNLMLRPRHSVLNAPFILQRPLRIS